MKQKKKNFTVTFLNSKITAAISIALVLFLLGLIIFSSLFANNLSNYIKESLSFDIVLQDGTSKNQIKKLQNTLEAGAFSKSVTYISKKEALKQLSEDLGQNPEEFLGFNPLPDMITVHLNAEYASVDSLAIIRKTIAGFENSIKETEYREDTLHVIGENVAKLNLMLLIIAAILLLISVALINNTIRLMVYSQRFLIHTMQLVGAKKWFIQRPFIVSNLVIGIIAALIANGLIYWLVRYLTNNIPNLSALYNKELLLIVFGCVLVLGIVISSVATFFAVHKFIRADVEGLYKM
jgi:cell division transport system permease protein